MAEGTHTPEPPADRGAVTVSEISQAPKGGQDGIRIRSGRLTAASAEAAFDIMKAALQRIAKAPAWGAPERWETTPFEVRELARETLESVDAALLAKESAAPVVDQEAGA